MGREIIVNFSYIERWNFNFLPGDFVGTLDRISLTTIEILPVI